MEFLYWCNPSQPNHSPICECFYKYADFRDMSVVPRDLLVRHTYPIPGRGQHIYGGIYQLARYKMLGVGINPDYILNAALNDDILLVAVEPITTTITKTKILGFVSLNIHNERCIEINVIASRNNHGGVGTTLMYHVLKAARQCGFNVCILKALVPAMEFYMKSNFTYLGTKDGPVFAMDLGTDLTVRPRAHMQRQNSIEQSPEDNRPLEEVEAQLVDPVNAMEKGYYFPRNIPLREYVDDIGKLKRGAPWKWLQDTRVHVKGGLFIPTDVNVEYVKHSWGKEAKVTRARNSVRTVRTYLNRGIKKSRSKSKNHVTINM
jgi:hypothetical protein